MLQTSHSHMNACICEIVSQVASLQIDRVAIRDSTFVLVEFHEDFRPYISSWIADLFASRIKSVTIPLTIKVIVTNLTFEAIRSASQLEIDGLKSSWE
jgi:hypothetical protein